jgi:hypothetical protein
MPGSTCVGHFLPSCTLQDAIPSESAAGHSMFDWPLSREGKLVVLAGLESPVTLATDVAREFLSYFPPHAKYPCVGSFS